jgi:anti-sigma28 factor (negative regulator of flagellin synthesis)
MSGINQIDINHVGLATKAALAPGDGGPASSDSSQTRTRDDSIALSDRAKAIDRLSGLVNRSRAERLAHVRAMLESGAYDVSGEDIARKMIELNSQ